MSNIQVVVRCRERNQREVKAKSQVVVELASEQYSISQPTITINPCQNSQISQKILNSLDSKTYTFDQVYGPLADQELVFKKAVNPIFKEFLNGFNVSILAYGQTGTGKTYTMCGKTEIHNKTPIEIDKHSGIIPRVLCELFSHLNSNNDDYFIKCSFIELYNENLRDLLNDDVDDSNFGTNPGASSNNKKGLKIFENRNGNSGIYIQNLTEVNINSLNSGFRLLNKGINKRKVASTKLNDFSSRSHTVFTINLYKKDPNDSETIKHSKINLVDLAGSENVSKSGSINQRAKEAGSINQSLLTLGRVITSLSEKSLHGNDVNLNHIPYRESKLTRLLQDSIGGKTKTLLISTISPAKINLEETLSTLDYSLKVKNIENKPQLGQDFDLIMKQILIKDLSNEIIKLNKDLISTRSRNGIYMDENNYNSLLEENASNKNELTELKSKARILSSKVQKLEDEIKFKEIEEASLKHSDSEDCLNLIRSITNSLALMKANFNNNFNQISEDIDESLKSLPNILNDLMKNLSNDELFNKFKNNQNELNNKLKNLNDQFQNHLVSYYNDLDVSGMIEQFFKESVENQVKELQQSFMLDLNKVFNSQHSSLNSLYKDSFNKFTNTLISGSFNNVQQESKNWNSHSNEVYKKITSNMSDYQSNIKNSHIFNQDRLLNASTNVKNSLTNCINPTLDAFTKGFTNDVNKLMNETPKIHNMVNSSIGHLTSNNDKFQQIDNLLGSDNKISPLKANDQKLNRSPSKTPNKHMSAASKIPTLKDKENGEVIHNLKKRKLE
ncbi:kinesin-domain-containing protein [Yamadazyma tenuis ATCC 10573]|uniref:Kinesin-like protein n=1 Tax=Candida tenuis (strain ATCC 10573 / BCRC 21748 / CBS 615 / JCM 9827 / NBRC 10315 / NRRL Y-1498 / VKM Y-70) TaxID=590646 RepID=G3B9U4_CANTC|nr:kinesin-domain-containing protein [Yamadazyma tenuis ATCC 10573]EGV61971.1 kinesin-domain-containing protein [Yamadazyma tenuis ATCC 10573]